MLAVNPTKSTFVNAKRLIDMQPLELGVIISDCPEYKDHVVMRTASERNFEVMDLTNPGAHHCFEKQDGTSDLENQYFGKYIVDIIQSPFFMMCDSVTHY